MSTALKGKVVLVTGASRGVGKGIAVELGVAGATVYITGRPLSNSDSTKAKTSTLEQVAAEITQRGGKGIAVYCDHSDPKDIKRLFEQIDREQNGQLDLLVNNALSCSFWLFDNAEKKFWQLDESPDEAYELVNNVALKNHFICSTYAAKMMIKRKTGLIINISSAGAFNYMLGVLFGISTSSLARMAADMSRDLEGTGVQSLALLPGWIKTEVVEANMKKYPDDPFNKYFINHGQTPSYVGRTIKFLLQNPNVVASYNGKSVTTTELGDEHNVLDVDGKTHGDPIVYKYKDFLDLMNKTYLSKYD